MTMTICGQLDPARSGWACIAQSGHRGRHAFRAVTAPPKAEVPPVMESTPDGKEVAVVETEHVEGEDPLPGRGGPLEPRSMSEVAPDPMPPDALAPWTPSGDDFINLKGKAYLPARRRIQWMRGLPVPHPEWTIDTEIVEHERGKLVKPGPVGVGKVEGGYVAVRANVFDEDGRLIATGLKSEYSENFTDYLEKAETGAIARALAVAGYGTESAIDLDEGVDEGRIADAPVEVPPVRLGPSSVEGVGRGGKTQGASVTQIRRVADLSQQLALGPSGLSSVIDRLFSDMPLGDLPGGEREASLAISNYLAGRSGTDVGKLIDTLESALAPTSSIA